MPAKKISLILAALGFFTLTACNAQEPAKKESSVMTKTLATVNGVAIPQSRFDSVLKDTLAQGQHDSPQLRDNIKSTLINQEIISQEAVKQGIDKTPDFQSKMDFARRQLLVTSYLHDYIESHPITDGELKASYEEIKKHMGDKEYKVRHILVKDENEAKDIIAKLGKKGANFAKIAAAKSEDPGSKTNGGELGWAPASNYVEPFAEAVTSLKKGEYTHTPVHTQFGWHVVEVEDVRALKAPAFADVKANLEARMQNQMVQKVIAGLRAAAKVE